MTRHGQAEELARAAVSAYELAPDACLTLLADGLTMAFRVATADRQFVLRLHRPGYRTAANTRAELGYLRDVGVAVTSAGVDVPQPVPTRDGNLIVEVSGDQHCDLLTWVDGEVRRPENGLDTDAVWQLGRALAVLHNAAEHVSVPVGLPRWDADGMFTAAACPFRPLLAIDEILSASDQAEFDAIAHSTRAIFAELDTDFGVIHFDYILGNTHLSRQRDGWRVGIFDFGDSGLGYYLYDLCPMLGNLAGYPAGAYNPGYPVLRDALLRGYRSARPLPARWEGHLPVLMAARHANHCFLTAGRGVSPTPREDAAWRMDLARLSLQLPI